MTNGVDPEQWLDEYGDWLYRFALVRVRDPHAAEDLVQETLVSGVRGFDGFQGKSTVKTWLTTILRRRIADHFQKTGRLRHLSSTSSERETELDDLAFSIQHAQLFHPKISNKDFQSSVEKDEFWHIVRNCLEKLPAHFRQAFVARITDDEKSLEELGAEMSVTKNNLSVRLFRARLLLRECLERSWTDN